MHWDVVRTEIEERSQILILSNRWNVMTSGWFSIAVSIVGYLSIGYLISSNFNYSEQFFRIIIPATMPLFILLAFVFFKKIIITISNSNDIEKKLLIKRIGIFPRKLHIATNQVDSMLINMTLVDWEGKTRATGTTKYDFYNLSILMKDGSKFKLLKMNDLSSKFILIKPNTIKAVEEFLGEHGNIPIVNDIKLY